MLFLSFLDYIYLAISCFVPHGGMIVAAATNNIALYTLDMAIGVAVGVAILVLTKPKLEDNK